MMPGIRLLQCSVCGNTREVEMGIRTMFCCAREMEEVEEQDIEKQSNREQGNVEDLHIRSGIHLMRCSVCGNTMKLEAGIRTMFCCGRKMEEVREPEEQAEGPQEVQVRIIDS